MINIDNGLDKLVDILPQLDAILGDEDIAKETLLNKDKSNRQVFMILLPLIIKKYKENVLVILSALKGEDINFYRNKSFFTLFKDMTDLLEDESISGFFQSTNVQEE